MDLLNFNFGVDVAIKKLRPGAKFVLSNMTFTEWNHELPPPTWDEINEVIEEDKKKYLEMGGEITG
jgi:hypothetical protein